MNKPALALLRGFLLVAVLLQTVAQGQDPTKPFSCAIARRPVIAKILAWSLGP